MTRITIGTRGSKLSRWQTDWVAAKLKACAPDIEIVIVPITTKGDAMADAPLPALGHKGLFTREIEAALLAGRIHVAVHSLKDLPTEPLDVIASGAKPCPERKPALSLSKGRRESPTRDLEIASSRKPLLAMTNGLTLAAIPERGDARDVVVSRLGLRLDELPTGARVGTSSPRRAAQLLARRPDLQIVNLRGNVDTRLRKAATAEYDAAVLAASGLLRLGYADCITEYLSFDVMLPAPGQGALAAQARADDAETLALLAALDHAPTRAATTAERAFLRALGGGCQVPIAAYGEVNGNTLHLRGLVASTDGKHMVRGAVTGAVTRAQALGEELAKCLLSEGGREIVRT